MTKEEEDISFFKENILKKKYQFLKIISEKDLEIVYPNLQRIKEDIKIDYVGIKDLGLDFIFLQSEDSEDEYAIYMSYNEKYSFTF